MLFKIVGVLSLLAGFVGGGSESAHPVWSAILSIALMLIGAFLLTFEYVLDRMWENDHDAR